MFDNLVNMVIAVGITSLLYFGCEVPIETSLLIGFVALMAYTLGDISRHLRNWKGK